MGWAESRNELLESSPPIIQNCQRPSGLLQGSCEKVSAPHVSTLALHVTLVPNPCHLQAGELSSPPLLQTMKSKSTQKRGLCPIVYLNFS